MHAVPARNVSGGGLRIAPHAFHQCGPSGKPVAGVERQRPRLHRRLSRCANWRIFLLATFLEVRDPRRHQRPLALGEMTPIQI
jgi:hypothetical protein